MTYRLLYKLLHDSEYIRDRVGSRIFRGNAPAGTKGACIILRRMGATINSHLQNESSVAQQMMQIDFYDDTMARAESGGELLRMRLSCMQRTTVQVLDASGEEIDVIVDSIQLRRPGEVIDEPRDASDKWSYRHSADYEVFHSQAVPTHV